MCYIKNKKLSQTINFQLKNVILFDFFRIIATSVETYRFLTYDTLIMIYNTLIINILPPPRLA